MSTRGGSWRIAGRLARREVRRHPWRHLLVTGLIFVPVFAALLAFSAVITARGVAERVDRFRYPAEDAVVRTSDLWATAPAENPDRNLTELARADGLPDGTRTEILWNTGDWLVGDGPHLTGVEVLEVRPGSTRTERFVIDQGRLPRSADEILLTAAAADDGGWKVGDTVTSARSDRAFRVVGIGDLGDDTGRRAAAVTGLPEAYWTQPIRGLDTVRVDEDQWQPTVADQELTAWVTDPGMRTDLLDNAFDGPRANEIDGRIAPGLTMAAAAICAVVAVVASAALAISSRRQLRTIGLLSTVGTDPVTVRRAMVLQGAVPGVIAGIAAVVVAAIGARAANAAGLLDRYAEVSGAVVQVSVSGALVVVLLGLGAGIAAAWQPARTASRIPTLSALAGRRPVGPVPTSVPVGGAILWACGACLLLFGFGSDKTGVSEQIQPFLVIAGVAAIALGGVGLAPLLIAGLAPLARRARGTWRMGLRGLARHRMQSAATVAAIGVVLAVPVGLLTSRNSLDDRERSTVEAHSCCDAVVQATTVGEALDPLFSGEHRGLRVEISGGLQSPAASEAVAEVQEVLGPSSVVIRTVPMKDQDGTWRNIATIDEAQAGAVLEPWAAEAITGGRAIALGENEAGGDLDVTAAGETASFEVDTARDPDLVPQWPLSADYLVGTDALGTVGAGRPPVNLVVARAEGISRAERTQLRRLTGPRGRPSLADSPTLSEVRRAVAEAEDEKTVVSDEVHVSLVTDGNEPVAEPMPDPDQSSRDQWSRVLLGLATASGLVALLVLTITLSLRSVDSEPDRRAALAAGVAPGALRRQRAFEGVVLALLGAVLALPLGWIPVTAARIGVDGGNDSAMGIQGYEVALPGWEVIPFLLAPALAAAILWTVVPALASAVRTARHRDLPDDLLPRV